MTARLIFRPDVPPEVRESVEPMLTKRLWRLPSWCHELEVDWCGNASMEDAKSGHTALAKCEADPEYRSALITLFPGWLMRSATEREAVVSHETSHVVMMPLVHLFDEALEHIPKRDRKIRDMLLARAIHLHEGLTCDLTESFERGEP